MIAKTDTLDFPADLPRRTLILSAITAFNLLFAASVIGITHVAPTEAAAYLSAMKYVAFVFLLHAALVYVKSYSKLADQVLAYTMAFAYIYAYTVTDGTWNPDLPSPNGSTTLWLAAICFGVMVALAWVCSAAVRLTVWSKFRLGIGKL